MTMPKPSLGLQVLTPRAVSKTNLSFHYIFYHGILLRTTNILLLHDFSIQNKETSCLYVWEAVYIKIVAFVIGSYYLYGGNVNSI